jgi:hypothetical protein
MTDEVKCGHIRCGPSADGWWCAQGGTACTTIPRDKYCGGGGECASGFSCDRNICKKSTPVATYVAIAGVSLLFIIGMIVFIRASAKDKSKRY